MMIFSDSDGRVWHLRLSLGAVMDLRDELGIDLMHPESGDPPLIARLSTDELLLGQVICSLLADQFDTHGLDAWQVRRSFDGATLLAAATAFWKELEDFFRQSGRPDRAKAVAKQADVIRRAVAASEAKIDAIDPDALVTATDGGTSGPPPEPSGSTPDR